MIRVSDPVRLGPALGEIRELLGISRRALARQIAEATGGDMRGIENQLLAWDRGLKSPTARSLGPALVALGYDLALVPRDES